MKMHKIELYVLDFEDYGIEECTSILEHIDPHGAIVKVNPIGSVEIGEWHDGHELNFRSTDYNKYFAKADDDRRVQWYHRFCKNSEQ